MIMCCRKNNIPFVTACLPPEKEFTDRKIEVATCSNCHALLAELTQFNTITGKYEVIRPKRKAVAKFIKQMQKLKWTNIKVKNISKGNMGYIYGENREYKDGSIHQYAVDFNGEKKLVKIIPASLTKQFDENNKTDS